MPITIKYNEASYYTGTILWDRDSFFIDFNTYWSRLIGSIAQKIAENTTDNWNRFNQVRTRAVVLLGVNLEDSLAESASPINVLPLNTLPIILSSGLKDLFQEKSRDELCSLFEKIIHQSSKECQSFIKTALVLKNIEIIKNINKDTKQILITNDSKENNDLFIKETGLEKALTEIHAQTNKEQISSLLNNNCIFITNNKFLINAYKNRTVNNVLLIEDLNKFSYTKSVQNEIITLNIDGASKGNPGASGIGIAFYKDKKIINEISEFIGNHTNNFAEYTALIRALEVSLEKGYKNIEILSDSELVVNQINKIYKVKDADIKDLFDVAYSLIGKLDYFKIMHIPRDENLKADKLANNALKSTHI